MRIPEELKTFLLQYAPNPAIFYGYELLYQRAMNMAFEEAYAASMFRHISTLDLSKVRRSERVFILGSGASINKISDRRWDDIEDHDSIGFNFWLIHDHVPTVYCCEAMSPKYGIPGTEDLIRRFIALAHEREEEYADVPKFIGDITMERLEALSPLPETWKKEMYAVPGQFAFASRKEQFSYALTQFEKWGLFEEARHIQRLVKYRGTLSKLICLAVNMGYKEIVLCGIDLSTPGYFYQDQELYPHIKPFHSSPPGKQHATISRNTMSVGIDDVVYLLLEQILKPRGIKLFIEHDASALYPKLPLYQGPK